MKEAKLKVEEMRKRLLTAQSNQKSYPNRRRKPLEFLVGDKVFIKVSFRRGIQRFSKQDKLALGYVGPFEILKTVGEVASQLALPLKLSNVHHLFPVLTLQKYESDPSHILDWELLIVKDDGTYFVHPMRILDRQDKVTKPSTITLVKVLWMHHKTKESTWELESKIWKKYPKLFDSTCMI